MAYWRAAGGSFRAVTAADATFPGVGPGNPGTPGMTPSGAAGVVPTEGARALAVDVDHPTGGNAAGTILLLCWNPVSQKWYDLEAAKITTANNAAFQQRFIVPVVAAPFMAAWVTTYAGVQMDISLLPLVDTEA